MASIFIVKEQKAMALFFHPFMEVSSEMTESSLQDRSDQGQLKSNENTIIIIIII